MVIIGESLNKPMDDLIPITVPTDRRTLAKTRWRGTASDGLEFGFELKEPLRDGAAIFSRAPHIYVIEQQPETLLRITVAGVSEAARIGWMIGNLHFPAQIDGGSVLVEADDAIRQMLMREAIPFAETTAIFRPIRAHAGHGHAEI